MLAPEIPRSELGYHNMSQSALSDRRQAMMRVNNRPGLPAAPKILREAFQSHKNEKDKQTSKAYQSVKMISGPGTTAF